MLSTYKNKYESKSFSSKKAIAGKALTVIVCSSLILILFFGFYFGLKAHFNDSIQELTEQVQNYQSQQKMLSLFTTDTIQDLTEGKSWRFEEALKNIYGNNLQCKLNVGENRIILEPCEMIRGFSQKLELEIPKQLDENIMITFEVVDETIQ
ncbi:hypothetical protein COV11_04605 [Candidatus Woesearchaeota archaeon CG10_big_fil_rev_8_21_14_0_10_30_7]|nr:MAG: hypothetical protein COV11_04605 [Candidatus Woesearchaeota archaeon CG10_big_fil_rev_8_21_14_0_10_30_7]